MKPNTRTNSIFTKTILAVAITGLAACGGGSSGGGKDTKDDDKDRQQVSENYVNGVLVFPKTTEESGAVTMMAKAASVSGRAAAVEPCPDVPKGYLPLSNVVISFKDSGGQQLAELTTDECGVFAGEVPEEVTLVEATPENSKPISVPVAGFKTQEPTLVSTFRSDASLEIDIIQNLGDGKLALTVTDTVSGKPVLGLTKDNFSFLVDAADVEESSVVYGSSTAQPATVSLVLDASGSMNGRKLTSEFVQDEPYPIQIASYAAHQFLDGLKPQEDEAGVVIFGKDVHVVNDAKLSSELFSWKDKVSGSTASYQFSLTGLTSDFSELRPIMDLYNPYSQIYNFQSGEFVVSDSGNEYEEVHPETGNVGLESSSLLSDKTSFYDAVSEGLNQVFNGKNPRKLVIAMTDGWDNNSVKTLEDIIVLAKQNESDESSVPVYTIGFGDSSSFDKEALESLAKKTDGKFTAVEGANLTGVFQNIQTGIRFQYVITLPNTLSPESEVIATVKLFDAEVSRELTNK